MLLQKLLIRKLILLILLFNTGSFCFGFSLDDIIPVIGGDTYEKLKQEHEISRILKGDEVPVLLPAVSGKKAILQKIEEVQPTIGAESLILFNVPYQESWDQEQMLLAMYNVLRSISTLKGITYYSASRKKNHILYSKAFIIDSLEHKNPVKDPVFYSIPPQSEVFAYFKDSSLGEYTCFISYLYQDHSFIMSMENNTAINYFFIPIVRPHGLLNYVIILPVGNEIIFYGFSCLKVTTFFGSQESKIDSLFNRLDAIYHWFLESYHYDE